MVIYKLDSSFSALSDPTRRDILLRLTHKEHTVGELAETYSMSQPAVSKHLKVLEAAGLVTKERRGRQRVVKVAPEVLRDITKHMLYYEMLLNNRLDSLDAFLKKKSVELPPVIKRSSDKKAEQKLVMSHVFDVEREEVWRAYTDAKQITQWWAPKGAALVACESDVRVGGQWRFVLYGGDGQQYTLSGIFREVEKPRRLVYTDGFGEATTPRPESLITVTFDELPGGRTRITKTSLATPAVHQIQAALITAIEEAL